MTEIEKQFKRIEDVSDRDLNLDFDSDKGEWIELSIEIVNGALSTDKGTSNLIIAVLKEVKNIEDEKGEVFTITGLRLEPYLDNSNTVFIKGYFT